MCLLYYVIKGGVLLFYHRNFVLRFLQIMLLIWNFAMLIIQIVYFWEGLLHNIKFKICMLFKLSITVSSKIIRALAIILVSFFWFDGQIFSSHAFNKQYKTKRSWFDKYLFYKTAFDMSFLTRNISNARIVLLLTVENEIT